MKNSASVGDFLRNRDGAARRHEVVGLLLWIDQRRRLRSTLKGRLYRLWYALPFTGKPSQELALKYMDPHDFIFLALQEFEQREAAAASKPNLMVN